MQDDGLYWLQLGLQHRRQRDLDAQTAQDRALRRDLLKQQIDENKLVMRRMNIADKLAARQAALQDVAQTETLPGPASMDVAPPMAAPTAEIEAPVPEGAPQSFRDVLMQHARPITLQGAPTPARLVKTAVTFPPHPARTIPGIPEWGIPEGQGTPRAAEQVAADTMADLFAKRDLERTLDRETIENPATGEPVTLPSKLLPEWLRQFGQTQRANTAAGSREDVAVLRDRGAMARAKVRAETSRGNREAQDDNAEASRFQQRVLAANRLLASENRQRAEKNLPALTFPPGTELAQLEGTQGGPGVRRWGGGAKMPGWLAVQYLKQARGNRSEAVRMAESDGWYPYVRKATQ